VRVSGVDKAFGATFVDVEGLKFVASLAYRKGGSLFVHLKGEKASTEEAASEVQREIEEVFKELLGLSSGDVTLKDRHASEYRYTVLNEKNMKKTFAKIAKKFKSEEE